MSRGQRRISVDAYTDYLRSRISPPCSPRIYTDEELMERAREMGRKAARESYQKLKEAYERAATDKPVIDQG